MGGGRSNLIGCRGIGAGVSSQAGQLLLHAEVGALAHAEEGGGHGQRHQDEEHAEDGEQQELARLHPGLLHHGDLSQAAPLKETEKRLLSSGGKTGRKKKRTQIVMRALFRSLTAKFHLPPPSPPAKHRRLNKLFHRHSRLHPPPLSDPSPLINQP